MIGGRARLVVALGAVLVTAGVSTAVAARDERATDERLRTAALAAVRLTVVPPDDSSIPFDAGPQDLSTYAVPVRNDGSSNVLVRRTTWAGGAAREANQLLVPNQAVLVRFAQPTTCPAHRTQERIDHVEVEVEVAGGSRTLQLVPNDPFQAGSELNSRCGLYRARESLNAGVAPVSTRPHEVTLDVSLAFNGPRPTTLLGVRATEGVTATLTERLPLTVPAAPPVPDTGVVGVRTLPHTFTVTLRLTDCAGPRSHQAAEDPGAGEYRQPPTFSELQLTVQHPGDLVEKVNLGIGTAPANALVAGCGIPPVAEVSY
jgi:hypothetical protein